ncbi:hypothetical protein [Hymenobacter sp. BT730]|uniref:hypothetical protein n=1 Tax=Hymenobacter sp. BT730 TaxID=3063332 RepID=UPI0026E0F475|nr:hypothetical protein [Hymenobacter sp. BT730]
MRQVVALLLLCSLSVHGAGRLGIVATWWLQRDYVARVLCVNRNKPQMRCNGKCHLAKRLKAADAAQPQPIGGKQAFHKITLYCPDLELLALPDPLAAFHSRVRYAILPVGSYVWDKPGPDHPPA